MQTLEEAIALAAQAHRGQKDKAGQPYVLHLLRVMFRVETEQERMVAVLHDLVEDTDYTFDDLRVLGYPEEILEALDRVTRRPEETYEEFVERSAGSPLSRRVKLADLEDNMDIRRYTALTEHDLERLQRYLRAWRWLKGLEE